MQFLRQYELLGENNNLEIIDKLLDNNSNFICNIFGEKGTGKTHLLNSINEILINNNKKVIFNSFQEYEFEDHMTLLIDDIDEKLTQSEFKDIILNIFNYYKDVKIFFVSNKRFFSNKITFIDNFIIALGNRNINYDEFEIWFDYIVSKNYNDEILSKILESVKKNIFLLCKYTKNFNYIKEIIHDLTIICNDNDINKSFVDLILSDKIKYQLEKDLYIKQGDEGALNIRGKNTVEKLKDLIIKFYPDQNFLYKVLKSTYNNSIFIEEIFNSKIPYEDVIIQLCFYYSPIELVCNLLGPRDVIKELDDRSLQSVDYSINNDEKIKIILRDIGLNILEKPKGLSYYYNVLKENYIMINDNMNTSMRKDHLIGMGIACFQEMENILFEFVNFYATYFCGSFSSFMQIFNGNERQTVMERITFDKYIDIIKFLNRVSTSEEFQIQMLTLTKKELVSKQVLDCLEQLDTFRKAVSHKHSHKSSFYTLKRAIIQIYDVIKSIMEELQKSNVYPEVIKIKKSILDEFGRKLIVAYDWNETEIRFSLSEDVDDLDINYHYYLLRETKNITINPLIIQRTISDNYKLFNKKDTVDNHISMHTQQKNNYNNQKPQQLPQSHLVQDEINIPDEEPVVIDEFLKGIDINDNSNVLVIGCGDGKIIDDLFNINDTIHIDVTEASKDLMNRAKLLIDEQNIDESKVSFFATSQINIDMEEEYDYIYTKSALHWINSSEIMYKKIYKALKFNGEIAIHQGGFGSYRGLHKMVLKAMKELDILSYYEGWKYPVYYPTKDELENYLAILGFSNIQVKSIETDGSEYDLIIENFSKVDMLPYINVLQNDILKKQLKDKFFELCNINNVDKYTHRLFITAEKK